MRKIKRLFIIVSTFLFAVSLASCDNTKRNTVTPMGDINSSTIIAKSGENTLTADVFYSQLRNQGFNTVLNSIKSNLFASEIVEVKAEIKLDDSQITDSERELFDIYAAEIYGTKDVEQINELTDDEKNSAIAKYIDKCNNEGITITKNDCLNFVAVEDEIKFNAIPEAIVNKHITSIAVNKAAKAKLNTIVDLEEIENSEGKLVDNTNYIDEDDIEAYYNNNNKKYGTYQAIVVQFNTLTEARKAIADTTAQVGELTDANALAFYIALYNNYYNYRVEIDSTTPFKDYGKSKTQTVFEVNEDENQLNEISSSIQSVITTTLENDGEYLTKPFNKNNKYLMVYRGETTFSINDKYSISKVDEDGYVEWETLKENAQAYNEVYAAIKEKLVETKVSAYTTTIIQDRIDAAEIEIYDPLFEMKFEASYADYYDLIDKKVFDNANIYKLVYNENTYTYSVNDFYAEQALASGVQTIYNSLAAEFAYNLKDLFLTEDSIEAIEKEVETSIKTFNKDENTAYPKAIGLETFLVANYGYATQELVVRNKVAQSALSSYLSDSLFDEWATEDHKVNYDALNALNNILATGNTKYNDIFSINIDHVLIYLDDNGDGTPDDPKEFTKYFSAEEKAAYEAALVSLANAIYAEANCEELTKSNDLMEILNYIVEAYSKNEKLYSDSTKTWADYKQYNFLLKVESLSSSGDTTQSNVTNYVKNFADYVRELYKVVVENDIKIEDDEPKLVFTTSLDKAPAVFEDLCATEFGYHMIVVNDYEKAEKTESLEKDDTNGYQKDIEVLINEKEANNTDDNIYVIVENTYNTETTKANINQLFVFYVQKQTGATSTLDSDVEEVLKAMFNDSISRYLSTGFQNFLLYKDLNAVVEYAPLATYYANYKGYLERSSQSYDVKDDFISWYADDMNWARPYNVK